MGAVVLLFAIVAFLLPHILCHFEVTLVNPLLGMVMLGMGLVLDPKAFRLVITRPKGILIGCVAQFTIMPLTAWALTWAFQLPPDLAIGVILVGCCPGGTASNIMTYLAGGDLALSVGMTAASTILAPILTPLIVFLLAGTLIDVDILAMLLSIVQIVILPISIGLLVQHYFSRFAAAAANYLPALSSLTIALIIGLVVSHNAAKLLSCGLTVAAVVMLHNTSGLALGFAAARLLRLPKPQRVALSIEVGMQNSALATSLATLHFAQAPLATVPGALFSVWHNISGALMASFFKRQCHDSDTPEA